MWLCLLSFLGSLPFKWPSSEHRLMAYWMSQGSACLHLQLEVNNTWLSFNSIPSSVFADSTAQHKNCHVHLTSLLLMPEPMLAFDATYAQSTVRIQRVSHQGEGLDTSYFLGILFHNSQAASNFRSASWIPKRLNVVHHHVYPLLK